MRSVSKLARLQTILLALALCAAPLLAAGTASISELQRFPDPLTLAAPTPQVLDSLRLPESTITPATKIVPQLWERLASMSDNEDLAIIVELQQPEHMVARTPNTLEWDAEQQELVAVTAHRFANRAGSLIQQARSLSHFPMIFGRATKVAVQRLAELPEVAKIFEDGLVYMMRTQGGALTKAATLRASYGGTGNGVGVAVVDSGIDATHPELGSRIVTGGDFTGTTGSGGIDDNGHGTACAGIIAGTNGGMAPQASLWAVKVMRANGTGSTSDILAGLNSLYTNRNNFGGLDIINMSLGGGGPFNSDCDATSAYNTILNSLYNAGISIFVASGNYGRLNGIADPACHSKVVAVGAVYDANIGSYTWDALPCTDNSTAADQITCYSDSGVPLDILAPSTKATTTIPGGYAEFGGTSAAAPYASGIAAQLLQLHPGTTPSQLRSTFMTTGKAITDVNGITRNRIDAVAAHQALGGGGGGTGPCVASATTACFQNGRFEAKVTWTTVDGSGPANVMYFGGQRATTQETAFFQFFSPTNFEMGLKVLNACIDIFNYKYWIFISGLTDQGWSVQVRDTVTGQVRTYTNNLGTLSATFRDQTSFNCQ